MSVLKFKKIYFFDHFKWSKFIKNAKEENLLDFFNIKRNSIIGNTKQYIYRKYRRKLFTLNASEMSLSLRRIKKKRKKTKISLKLLNQQRALKQFYTFKYTSNFKKIYLKTLKLNRNIYLKFLLNLENRLDSLLVRANLCLSNLEAQQLIKHKKILVNTSLVKNPNFSLTLHDTITLVKNLRSIYLNILKNRFKYKIIFYHEPKYLEINYKLLTFLFIEKSFKMEYLPFFKKFNFNIKDIGYSLKI